MKKQILLIALLIAIAYSCTEDKTYITEETYYINEADLKASQMEQIGSLFESIARQPEAAEELINATETMLYLNISELLPISDTLVAKRGEARGKAFSAMFEAIARQPEAKTILNEVAVQFLGKYDESIINEEMLDFQKAYASPGIITGIARNPMTYNEMDTICQDFFNCNLDELIIE